MTAATISPAPRWPSTGGTEATMRLTSKLRAVATPRLAARWSVRTARI